MIDHATQLPTGQAQARAAWWARKFDPALWFTGRFALRVAPFPRRTRLSGLSLGTLPLAGYQRRTHLVPRFQVGPDRDA